MVSSFEDRDKIFIPSMGSFFFLLFGGCKLDSKEKEGYASKEQAFLFRSAAAERRVKSRLFSGSPR